MTIPQWAFHKGRILPFCISIFASYYAALQMRLCNRAFSIIDRQIYIYAGGDDSPNAYALGLHEFKVAGRERTVPPSFSQSIATATSNENETTNTETKTTCGRTNFIRRKYNNNQKEFPLYYPPPLPSISAETNSNSNLNSNSTDMQQFRIAQKPLYGNHRCENNAVLAFCHGYQLPRIIHFVSTLAKTGYDGDLVLGMGSNLTQETRSYLEHYHYHQERNRGNSTTTTTTTTTMNLVVYEISLKCQRKNSCQLQNLLEQQQEQQKQQQKHVSSSWIPVPDSRPFRRVSMVRYEYYWAWANRYSSKSLLFLSDARDVYFQKNPMQVAERAIFATNNNNNNNTNSAPSNNILVAFEETSTIAQSKANSKWLEHTYSSALARELAESMVLCSGTTLGSQPAIETYARAMVYEFDQTRCRRCANKHDQCFHNYLLHNKQKLLVGANGHRISQVVIHPQGQGGIVNTVGLVSKSHAQNSINNNNNNSSSSSGGDDYKSLQDLGLVHPITHEILENDRTTVSAVVHMYDRDAPMKEWVDGQIQKELETVLVSLQSKK